MINDAGDWGMTLTKNVAAWYIDNEVGSLMGNTSRTYHNDSLLVPKSINRAGLFDRYAAKGMTHD